MKNATKGLVVALVVFGVAGAAGAETVHVRKGVIVAAGPGDMVMVLDNNHRHTLVLADATKVYDDMGKMIRTAGLRTGDYVQEECLRLPDGRFVAKRIILLRPAWRDLQSPEL